MQNLKEVPRELWPQLKGALPLRVLLSDEFLVQVYREAFPVLVRLSINRVQREGDRWRGDISWDELQRLKEEAGYGDMDAVEIFPPTRDLVDVANMRHLWIMMERLPFAWRNGETK